jgi:hypothetical protein
MLTPANTGKTISAIQSSTGSQNVTYKVTKADAGITWSGVSVSWDGGSGDVSDSTITGADTASGDIEVGDYFTIEFPAADTYTADLIYDGSIIWTSPTVAVS